MEILTGTETRSMISDYFGRYFKEIYCPKCDSYQNMIKINYKGYCEAIDNPHYRCTGCLLLFEKTHEHHINPDTHKPYICSTCLKELGCD